MELKLNIYTDRKLKKIEKTYKANDFDLSTGVCEDLLHIIKIDMFENGLDILSEDTQMVEIVKMVVSNLDTFKEMLKEIFDGLTNDEISRTSMKEIAKVVVLCIKFSLVEMFASFGDKRKN